MICVMQRMDSIDKLYANGDWDSIINKYSGLDINNEGDKVIFCYGLALHHRSLFEKSIQILNLVEFNSDYFCISRLYNGLSSMSLGDFILAKTHFVKVINSTHRLKLQVLESVFV